MNLFEDIEAENYKFINVIEALELVAKKIDYSVSDVARRLLLDGFNKIARIFKINDYEKIEIFCSEKDFEDNYSITTEFLKLAISTSGSFDYIQTDTYGNEYENTKSDWFDFYWLKSDFFNFLSIKKIGISEECYENYLQANSQENLYDFIAQQAIHEQNEMAKEDARRISQRFFKEQEELNSTEKTFTNSIPLFYLNDSFSIIEASCLISGDDPIQINRCINDTNFDQNYLKFSEAYSFINSAICVGILPKIRIPADQLKAHFKNKGRIIPGFNDMPFSQLNSSEKFEYSNFLKFNFSKELDDKYIRIFTVVDFIKKMTSLNYNEIIIHIRKIFKNLELYTLDENLTPVTGLDFCDYNCIDYLCKNLEKADENIIELGAARYLVDEYFWSKDEFFNCHEAVAFDLSKKNYNIFLMASMLNPDEDNIFLNYSDMSILKKILANISEDQKKYVRINFDSLNKKAEENIKLKAELVEKDQKIKELESLNLKKNTDLLSLIFDETSKERYAPDLVFAINAWRSIYIDNPKTDSHNNKANTWISNNTPYSGEQEDTATRRLREVISPYSEWKDTRKKIKNN